MRTLDSIVREFRNLGWNVQTRQLERNLGTVFRAQTNSVEVWADLLPEDAQQENLTGYKITLAFDKKGRLVEKHFLGCYLTTWLNQYAEIRYPFPEGIFHSI